MVEAKGKYSGLLSEIKREQHTTSSTPGTVFLPEKKPLYTGKRSDPAYIQKGIFLKKDSIAAASDRLDRRGDKTDFSDLMQALLEVWLKNTQ